MKQPSLRQLTIDRAGTDKIRTALLKNSHVTITVNLDAAQLQTLTSRSKKSDMPYQRLLKTLLPTSLSQEEAIHSRLDRLEQELRKMKRRHAA